MALMTKDRNIPIHVLLEAMDVNVDEGFARWRARPSHHFKRANYASRWNERWAWTDAFTSDNGKGYATTSFTHKGQKFRLQLHRVVFAVANFGWPQGLVDHIDGDTRNNRAENLRDVSNSENMRNCALSRSNTTGRTGVYWFKPRKCWTAQICVSGRQRSLGYFKELQAAIAARKEAEIAYGFTPRASREGL